jgi:DNA-directed RNA polymerase subunit E'/Rpb7
MSVLPGKFKKNKHASHQGLYHQVLITKNVPISINNIGHNIKETLERAIALQIEGKCIVEGYIKPNTIEIITFSSGLVTSSNVIFEVVIQCMVCSPVEGMHIHCIAKHINKAGIRAEVKETPSPVVIFIARDHNYASPVFAQVKENDEIKVRVIGQRFELNDTYISIIAELIENFTEPTQKPYNIKTFVPKPATKIAPAATLAPATLTLAPAPATLAPATLELEPPVPTFGLAPSAPIKSAPIRVKVKKTASKKPKITIDK